MKAAYILLLFAVTLSLIGCSSIDAMERHTWVEQNRSAAEAGQIKWSDFYSELHRMTAQADEFNSKDVLETINTIYKAALAYEGGKLGKSEFVSLQRVADQRIAELELKSAPQGNVSEAAWGRGTRIQERK